MAPNRTRILHVASHIGNIGDDASHAGLRKVINELLGEVEIDKLDIRKAYQTYNLNDRWNFDSGFVKLANSYDLVIVGGGSYLDYSHPGTKSGATIDIPPELVKKISVPLLICSVSCRPRSKFDTINTDKIQTYLEALTSQENISLLVRNDGSKDCVRRYISSDIADRLTTVLDSGFFYENDGLSYRPCEGDYISINTTRDQLGFYKRRIGEIDQAAYEQNIAAFVRRMIEETDLNVVFAPHILADLPAINGVLHHLPPYSAASRVAVMPYAQGSYGCRQIYSGYKNSRAAIGMRFHANACGMAMGVPMIGLGATERVVDLFSSLGATSDLVDVTSPDFVDLLYAKVNLKISDPADNESLRSVIESARSDTIMNYSKQLQRLGFQTNHTF